MKAFVVGVFSFFLGVGCTMLLLNRVTVVSPVFAEGTDPSSMNPAIPKIPGLLDETHDHETIVGNGPIFLDGLQAKNSIYAGNPLIVYGGGAFKLDHMVFSRDMSLQLVGAAANTVQLLEFLGFIRPNPEPPTSPPVTEKGKPFVRHIPTTRVDGEFASPYDGK